MNRNSHKVKKKCDFYFNRQCRKWSMRILMTGMQQWSHAAQEFLWAVHSMLIYEVWQKSNETYFLFTKLFILSNNNVIPFKIVPLGCYTLMEMFLGCSAWSLQPIWSAACLLYSFGCFQKSRNDDLWRHF